MANITRATATCDFKITKALLLCPYCMEDFLFPSDLVEHKQICGIGKQ